MLRYGAKVLAEERIYGRELTVAVLGDRWLPAVETVPAGKEFDYVAKYQAGAAVETCPADVPPAVMQAAGELALRIHRALGLEVYSRTDMILDKDGNLWVPGGQLPAGHDPQQLCPQGGRRRGHELQPALRGDRAALLRREEKRVNCMQPMTIPEIISAVDGTWLNPRKGAAPVTAVCTDSRKIAPGCLFLPWVGERFDGHDFIDSGPGRGSRRVLVRPGGRSCCGRDKFYIQVADTRLALRALASAYRGPLRASPLSRSPAAWARPPQRRCWRRCWGRSSGC